MVKKQCNVIAHIVDLGIDLNSSTPTEPLIEPTLYHKLKVAITACSEKIEKRLTQLFWSRIGFEI